MKGRRLESVGGVGLTDTELLPSSSTNIAILGSRLRRRTLGLLTLSLFLAALLYSTITRYDPFAIQPLILSRLPARFRPSYKSPPTSHNNMSAAPVKRTAAVIFSHGLGDSSAGWSFLAQQLGSHMPWVDCFPDAPVQPVTLNMGARMQSWFDILGLRPDAPEDEKGLLESVKTIQSLVEKQVQAGIPSERIVVGGFSQGAAISILTGLMSPSPLAGVVCLSGFLTLKDKIKQLQTPHASKLNVFWGHGTHDPVVQYQWGAKSVDFLKEDLGLTNVDFRSYPDLVHSASPLELRHLSEWLMARLPNQ
ncbi:hypothetical protein PGT21_002511 [Puccinia graminis f. sp. tritici]|uniref:Acyl-protein thioesterase 1 n=1 Tax=Puccinia graminis f. sp. tritici TaxID=56615 RepID=A0A5B0RSM1_PUCGR|nr:hypothetical protein PGT21_002511 [Puccinia graminis f. sp. tritici]KAA1128045.1 hypothetical protein PGTUg99_015660 [Puccinia graminis f. sp. tritici]